jgi:hypothetical protein
VILPVFAIEWGSLLRQCRFKIRLKNVLQIPHYIVMCILAAKFYCLFLIHFVATKVLQNSSQDKMWFCFQVKMSVGSIGVDENFRDDSKEKKSKVMIICFY